MSVEQTVRNAIKGQYHAALAMLGEAIRICPEEMWTQGTHPRQFWRIAYHGLFYAQLYIERDYPSFQPWSEDREDLTLLDDEPRNPVPYTREELLSYWSQVVDMVDEKIDAFAFEDQQSGFDWYKDFPKLDHVLLSCRHIQEHAGQLRDRLIEAGLDPHWVSRGKEPTGGWS